MPATLLQRASRWSVERAHRREAALTQRLRHLHSASNALQRACKEGCTSSVPKAPTRHQHMLAQHNSMHLVASGLESITALTQRLRHLHSASNALQRASRWSWFTEALASVSVHPCRGCAPNAPVPGPIAETFVGTSLRRARIPLAGPSSFKAYPLCIFQLNTVNTKGGKAAEMVKL